MKDAKEAKAFFWPYDLFGYLLPGFLAVAAVLCLDEQANKHFMPRIAATWYHATAIVVVSYIVGHLLAATSSFFIERLWIKMFWGDPYLQLLENLNGVPPKDCWFWESIRWLRRHIFMPCAPFSVSYCEWLKDVYNRTFGFVLEPGAVAAPAAEQAKRDPAELFWTASSYLMQGAVLTYQHVLHFVELYGFSRNGAMGCLVIAALAYYRNWTINLCDAGGNCFSHYESIYIWGPALGCAFVLYLNYVKLFIRHNQLVLRGFMAIASETLAEKADDEAQDDNEHD